ncbi:MAG: AraC family ligand binding domain-containing protein, partial [Turicibacter sp.]
MKYFKMNLSQLFNVTYMGQCKFDEDWVHFARRTDTYVLYFVKEGDLFIEEEGTKYHVKEGEYLLLEPNKFHVGYKSSAITYYFIHFTNSDFTCMGDYTLEMVEKDIVSRRLVSLASDITTSDYQED